MPDGCRGITQDWVRFAEIANARTRAAVEQSVGLALFLLPLSYPDTGTAPIFVDELDARCLERRTYLACGFATAAQRPVLGL